MFPQSRLPEAPKIGQRVRIEGQPGMYLVLRLDTKRFAADLMLLTGTHDIEHDIPYFAIEPIEEVRRARPKVVEEEGMAARAEP